VNVPGENRRIASDGWITDQGSEQRKVDFRSRDFLLASILHIFLPRLVNVSGFK
jgi:hypothetical protein